MSKIDWSRPIEAVHRDGKLVVPMRYIMDNSENDMFFTEESPNGSESNSLWHADGSNWCSKKLWRIRNTQPNTITLDRDTYARIDKLLRHLADRSPGLLTWHADSVWRMETISLANLLPKEADPDPDIQIVRDILHAYQRSMTPPDSGWGNMSYAKGSYDHTDTFKAALEAYKARKGEK